MKTGGGNVVLQSPKNTGVDLQQEGTFVDMTFNSLTEGLKNHEWGRKLNTVVVYFLVLLNGHGRVDVFPRNNYSHLK